MTEIILVRHGETDWNVSEVFRGRIDVELNETGLKQAELLAEYLNRGKVEAVYSSPLRRASKTAEIIATKSGIEVKITPGLIDFDFGEWQGLSHQEVKNKYKELYIQWLSHPEQVRMPGGEDLGEVRARTLSVIDDVIRVYQGVVILVSHRVVNKVLICAMLGLDNSHFWNIKQDTCGITSFAYEQGQFLLTGHNNTSFLETVSKVPLGDF